MFADDIRRQRVSQMPEYRQWRWHLDKMYAKLNGEIVYLAFHEECASAPRLARGDRYGQAALLSGSDEQARQDRDAGAATLV